MICRNGSRRLLVKEINWTKFEERQKNILNELVNSAHVAPIKLSGPSEKNCLVEQQIRDHKYIWVSLNGDWLMGFGRWWNFQVCEISGNSEKYEFRIIFKSKLVSLLTKFTTNTVEISLHFFYISTSSSQISSPNHVLMTFKEKFFPRISTLKEFFFLLCYGEKKREIKNRQQPGLAKKKVVTTHK